MTKETRMLKAWGRNYDLWMRKGVYINSAEPIKKWLSPKDVLRKLKKESIELKRMWKHSAFTVMKVKPYETTD